MKRLRKNWKKPHDKKALPEKQPKAANIDAVVFDLKAVNPNVHVEKPQILQATDSKWWGWKDDLAEVGIAVQFLCPEYVEAKYAEKMGT